VEGRIGEIGGIRIRSSQCFTNLRRRQLRSAAESQLRPPCGEIGQVQAD
jgi:hypothetical protein